MLEIKDILEGDVKKEGKILIDAVWIPERYLELDEENIIERTRDHLQLDMKPEEFLIKAESIIAIQYHYEYGKKVKRGD